VTGKKVSKQWGKKPKEWVWSRKRHRPALLEGPRFLLKGKVGGRKGKKVLLLKFRGGEEARFPGNRRLLEGDEKKSGRTTKRREPCSVGKGHHRLQLGGRNEKRFLICGNADVSVGRGAGEKPAREKKKRLFHTCKKSLSIRIA